MVVTCENCGSRYAVDPLAIGPAGRTVQCARCDHRWFQTVEGPPPPAPPPPDVVIRPITPGSSLPVVIPSKPKLGWRRLVAVAVVVLALLAAALFAFRHQIATMMSQEARASSASPQTASAPAAAAVAPKPAPSAAAQEAAARPPVPPPTAAPIAAPPQAPQSVVRTNSTVQGPAARPGLPRPQIEVDLSASKIDVVNGRYVVRGELVNKGKAAGSTTLLKLTFKRNEDVLGERSFPMVEGPLPPGGRTSFTQTLDDPPSGTTDIVPVVE